MEKEVYRGQIVKVTEEKIEDITWERVYLPSGVIIFPINEKGQILMIEEKRPHENPPQRIKPVSGILELDKGTAEENAQRELQEEIGLKAGVMENFWTMNATGTVNSQQFFYIARNLTPSKLPNPDGEDTILAIKTFDLEELRAKFLNDEIKWSMSTLGFFRLYQHLKTGISP
jgi:8-oxo-dGTP pyrophosphatase MutT (NUDIX family)